MGVRYPAVAELAGKILVAGGETGTGTTADASRFDPRTGRVSPMPRLPASIDHAAGVSFEGCFYVLGGLRSGRLSDAVYSWTPGSSRFRRAGRLPTPLSDAAAVPYAGESRWWAGALRAAVNTVISMRPR